VIPDQPFAGFNTEIVVDGNHNVEPVELLAYELGWRAQVTPRFTLDVAAFYNQFENGVLFTQGTPTPVGPTTILVPLVPVNDGRSIARGFEVAAAWEATDAWKLSAGWAFLDVHERTDGAPSAFSGEGTTAPQSQLIIDSRHDLAENIDFDILLIHIDELVALDVPAYWRADLRMGYRPEPATEWSIGLRNLFHNHELEWAGEPYGGQSESETSAWLGYTRRF